MFETIFLDFFVRLAIDLISVSALSGLVYYRNYRRSDLFLTFFAFNAAIFLVTFLLNKVEMSLGAAFGLFAVFSMLRYRTEQISITDMTYLFLVIALGLLSAISGGNWLELTLFNLILLILAFVLEGSFFVIKEMGKAVMYENIDLIVPERRAELLEDLRRRTGLNVHRVDIESIDFLRDATQLTVYYYP